MGSSIRIGWNEGPISNHCRSVLSGVIQKDTPDELVLSAGPDKITRIPRSIIGEMTRSNVSIMPKGLDQSLTEQQLADLVSYLKSLQ